jgi:hypothetical protein
MMGGFCLDVILFTDISVKTEKVAKMKAIAGTPQPLITEEQVI